MDTRVYWIWLQQALGVGAPQSNALLERFGSAKAIYEAQELPLELELTATQKKRLSTHDTQEAQSLLRETLQAGAWLLTPDDVDYPPLLRGIYALPTVLYGRGNCLRLEQAPTIAVVGTRDVSEYGVTATRRLAAGLAAGGAIVASGGAVGVDSEALTAAMDAGGVCVSLQACGIDIGYPSATAAVRERLLATGGMLLTEFPLGETAHKHHFRIRNRLISGMANGVCVTEAPLHSGALLTASWGREQGRDVYVVPGAVTDWHSEGGNRLLKDGAHLITGASDVLLDYVARFPTLIDMEAAIAAEQAEAGVSWQKEVPRSKPKARTARVTPPTLKVAEPSAAPPPCPTAASETAKAVFAAMRTEPRAVDEIARETGAPLSAVLAALTELELYGVVRCTAGQQYALHPAAECPLV